MAQQEEVDKKVKKISSAKIILRSKIAITGTVLVIFGAPALWTLWLKTFFTFYNLAYEKWEDNDGIPSYRLFEVEEFFVMHLSYVFMQNSLKELRKLKEVELKENVDELVEIKNKSSHYIEYVDEFKKTYFR